MGNGVRQIREERVIPAFSGQNQTREMTDLKFRYGSYVPDLSALGHTIWYIKKKSQPSGDMSERSKELRSGRSIERCVSSNLTVTKIFLHTLNFCRPLANLLYAYGFFLLGKQTFFATLDGLLFLFCTYDIYFSFYLREKCSYLARCMKNDT